MEGKRLLQWARPRTREGGWRSGGRVLMWHTAIPGFHPQHYKNTRCDGAGMPVVQHLGDGGRKTRTQDHPWLYIQLRKDCVKMSPLSSFCMFPCNGASF